MTTTNPQPTFVGPLAASLSGWVAEQQALGYHYTRQIHELSLFDRWSVAIGHAEATLPQVLVEQWTAKRAHESEASAVVPGDPAKSCCDALEPVQAQDRDREVTERREHLGSAAGSHLGTVLVEHAVAHVVTAVLDRPMAADVAGELGRAGLLGREVGHVVGGLHRGHAVSEVRPFAIHRDELASRAKAELVGEAGRDLSDAHVAVLGAAVAFVVGLVDDRCGRQEPLRGLGEPSLSGWREAPAVAHHPTRGRDRNA